MTTRPHDLPPLASAPVGPAGKPGAPNLPDAPGADSPASPNPRGEAGARAANHLHTACDLAGSFILAAAQMAEDKGDGSVEAHLRRYLKDLRLPLAYHPWREHARRAAPGYPDWTITGAGGLLFRELKRQHEKPTDAQVSWLLSLRNAGSDSDIWRPCCILSGRVARELAVIARVGMPNDRH